MDNKGISRISHAQECLKSLSSYGDVILAAVRISIENWEFQSNDDLISIQVDLNNLLQAIKDNFFQTIEDEVIWKSVHCVVFNELHENLFSILKEKFATDDLRLYEKCVELCNINISPKELGSRKNYAIRFPAAIVELSIMDNLKSPLEKINCLCSTYDLLFAELKTAMVTMISKYSEKDNDIPIIENEEVIPILMVVISKSKLFYLCSNFYYIKLFAERIFEENINVRTIFQMFEIAIENLQSINTKSLKPDRDKLGKSMNVCETMKFVSMHETQSPKNTPPTLLDEEKLRIAGLITTSTTEKL